MVVRGRFDVDGGGLWWWSSGSSLTTMGSLFKKIGRQVVVMAHGDTSYDDLGLERSQKTADQKTMI